MLLILSTLGKNNRVYSNHNPKIYQKKDLNFNILNNVNKRGMCSFGSVSTEYSIKAESFKSRHSNNCIETSRNKGKIEITVRIA